MVVTAISVFLMAILIKYYIPQPLVPFVLASRCVSLFPVKIPSRSLKSVFVHRGSH